jgi:predicted permease
MSEEMRVHLEMATEANVAAGMAPAEARAAARREFGGVDQVKEAYRDQRGLPWLEDGLRDFSYAVRQLARTPGFTAITVLTLALGIGLATVQFSFVYGAMIKGLPFEGAERIQAVETADAQGQQTVTGLRYFLLLRAEQKSFEQFAAYRRSGIDVSGTGLLARRYNGAEASAEVFPQTGVLPLLGRTLQAADEQAGAPRVLVLSHPVWKNDFAADPSIVGRALRVNGEPATVVGVMPAGFHFPLAEQAWINFRLPVPEAAGWSDIVSIVARLRPGVTLAQARSEFDVLLGRIAQIAPKRGRITERAIVTPFAEHEVGGPFATVLWTLLALVGLVLVLACVNVANLIHARLLRQRHELAVRAALGASRGRLLRQMLSLSTVLAGLGAAAGVLLAMAVVPLLNPLLADPKKPYWVTLEIGWRVLAGTALLTLAVALLSGLVPALRMLRPDPQTGLRDGGKGATELHQSRLGRVLSVAQIALATAVLVVGAVLSRGIYRAGAEPYPGDTSRMLVAACETTALDATTDKSALAARRQALFQELFVRGAGLPGVTGAALTDRDQTGAGYRAPLEIAGRPADEAEKREQFPVEWVSPGYFAVFDLRPLRGRLLTDADVATGDAVAVINESCARRYWPGADPIGQLVRTEGRSISREPWRRVIGVVPDLPMLGVGMEPHTPGIYVPLDLATMSRINLLLRTSGDPAGLVNPLRDILRDLAPDQPFKSVLTLQQAIDQRLLLIRILCGMALVFGATGGLLAALGIFGVMAFFVEQQRREFGVRLALGARPAQILGLVLHRGLGQLAIGLTIGLVLGWALNWPLQNSVSAFRAIAHLDAGILLLAATVVTASVLLACWLPARRAAKVDPLEALRSE